MTKRRIRKITLAIVLLLILALLGAYFGYYKKTKQLGFDIAAPEGAILPPEFLYSFSGPENLRIQRPIGVHVDEGNVYVTDGVRSLIYVFDEAGEYKRSFTSSDTVAPLYIAKNPKDGNLYVTDRGKRAVLKFSTSGKYLGIFDPKLPKEQRPKVDTKGVAWTPVAITFAPDGTMYVTETLNGHRLLIFGPDGKFKRSVGTAGIVTRPEEAPMLFQFPNGLLVMGKELFVADSNNQRIQVFDLKGDYQRMIVTQGLPRGITALDRFSSDTTKTADRFVEVDTLSHDATIWSADGKRLLSFGEQGALDGQFNYPTGASLGSDNKIFVADSANGRVDVWGWPSAVVALPPIVASINPWLCLVPLLFLPLLLLLRKRQFVATPDFVEAMIAEESADLMPARRRKWLAKEDDYELIKPLRYRDIDMGELFEPSDFSESDAQALAEKLEIDVQTASTLALAQRGKVFCTTSAELRRLAKSLELDVVDVREFVERYSAKSSKKAVPPASS